LKNEAGKRRLQMVSPVDLRRLEYILGECLEC